MKRFVKWFCKLEIYTVILCSVAWVSIIAVTQKDDRFESWVGVLFLPIMLSVFQMVMESKMKNHEANIDVSILRFAPKKVVLWRDSTKPKTNKSSVIEVVNTGNVMIYSMYVCVTSYSGVKNMLYIGEDLPIGETMLLEVPERKRAIEKIEITYHLNTEGRTKCFGGTKTKSDDRIIFSQIKKYVKAKDTIDKKYEVVDFKPAEKFAWKK